ncbi:MAG: flagellar basal body P-ring formation chaperone FlgA [candidate division Zixibacteria bacterium]|jgi:flagella basal body P-ring formation protein FlgA|nr:flagellar basal body P-ring formation chaperone FlgA [candidate division Zixibacteria bacterium]
MERLKKILFWLLILSATYGTTAAGPKEDVVEWVIDSYQLDPQWYEVEVLEGRLDYIERDYSIAVDKPLTQKEPIGLFSVLATVTYQNGTTETVQVRLRIRKFADVVVADDRMSRFDVLSPERLRVERTDITTLREQPLTSTESVAGLRAARNIRRGDILTTGSVEPIPDIEAGRDVTIVYQDGPCTITAMGKALERGCRGETVRVRNVSSGKVITAEIIDNSSVTVTP